MPDVIPVGLQLNELAGEGWEPWGIVERKAFHVINQETYDETWIFLKRPIEDENPELTRAMHAKAAELVANGGVIRIRKPALLKRKGTAKK